MASLTIYQGAQRLTLEFVGQQPLYQLLEQAGIAIARPCAGRGVCGKCAVILNGDVSAPNEAEQAAGTRLACQAQILGDAQVWLPEGKDMEQIQTEAAVQVKFGVPMQGKVGAAVDIGTTTVVLRRYDLQTGNVLGESAMANPQGSIAADVMGRIGAAMEGQLEKLQRQIQDAISVLLQRAGGSADCMVITGNTTMLYLLTGRDPKRLSCVPFEADCLFDEEITVCGIPAYLPACMNAFVGADITCATFISRMCEGKTTLLCDVGTNGEIALWKDGTLYVTSTAAGPAFEGAGISCGCSSVRGAIDTVQVCDGQLQLHTIGDAPAVGLCGSGLIDAVAALLKLEWMDETGALEDDDVVLAPGVVLTQKDIRSMQLAKAAIAAGIATLLEVSNTDPDEIETLYLAGGFGSHLNIQSAAAIGLFPEELTDKVKVIGNAALAGAAQLLLNEPNIASMRSLAANSKHWNLGGDPRFNNHYMDQMFFPEI